RRTRSDRWSKSVSLGRAGHASRMRPERRHAELPHVREVRITLQRERRAAELIVIGAGLVEPNLERWSGGRLVVGREAGEFGEQRFVCQRIPPAHAYRDLLIAAEVSGRGIDRHRRLTEDARIVRVSGADLVRPWRAAGREDA